MASHPHSLSPISDEALVMIASWVRVLAEPSRRRILRALEGGEKTITDLVVVTGTTQANVSCLVPSLAEVGMVGRRKEGRLTI